jgi:predicted nucleotidyltransferase
VHDHLIYAAVVGSQAFGLATATSDTDYRGVYVAPTPSFWGFDKPPKHVEGPEAEWLSWEVERFCLLALAGHPNALEALHSPLVLKTSDLGTELVGLRKAFLSRQVHTTYTRYGPAQLRQLRGDSRRDGRPRWKHAMHVLRLLLAGEELLRTGHLQLDVGSDAERLLAVRRGELSWAKVEAWAGVLRSALDEALTRTPLPDVPDRARVDTWLRSVRERNVAPT